MKAAIALALIFLLNLITFSLMNRAKDEPTNE